MSKPDDVTVEHSSEATEGGRVVHSTVIKDLVSNRAWSGQGDSVGAASTEATRRFISDRRAREYQGS